ncbi:MAG: putative replication initiation protein [Bacteriophage sp.]|nr:MAG: putative replication initiation protein [Bacteriophage sp.]
MACKYPQTAYVTRTPSRFGRNRPTWDRDNARLDPSGQPLEMQIPCSHCYLCKRVKSLEWAIRAEHELRKTTNQAGMFLTLTYAEEHKPADGSLNKKHLQDFLKRLRIHLNRKEGGLKIRYLATGEYGEKKGRPHYHALIFGWQVDDLLPIRKNKYGHQIWWSETLEKIWGMGDGRNPSVFVGAIEPKSAHYVARYTTKKVNGPRADTHYETVIPDTGEIVHLVPEFILMSKKPPIGDAWYRANRKWLWAEDEIPFEIGGRLRTFLPPRAYLDMLRKEEPDEYRRVMDARDEKKKTGKELPEEPADGELYADSDDDDIFDAEEKEFAKMIDQMVDEYYDKQRKDP